jgi:hypothetical protein
MTDHIWTAGKSADPTDHANWYPDTVPVAGDVVTMATNVMYLKGTTLDGTDFHLGYDGSSVAPPGPVLDLLGGSNLKLSVMSPNDNGNAVTINAFDHNTVDLHVVSDHFHNTLASTTINVEANGVLTGHMDVYGGAKLVMTGADHAVFDSEGTNTLTYANHDVVKIMPDMIGTSEWKMAFSNLEVGGSVVKTQSFQLQTSSSMTVDKAEDFHGSVEFLRDAGSTLTLKDVHTNDYSYDGKTVTFITPDHGTVGIGVKIDLDHNYLNVTSTSAGTELFVRALT